MAASGGNFCGITFPLSILPRHCPQIPSFTTLELGHQVIQEAYRQDTEAKGFTVTPLPPATDGKNYTASSGSVYPPLHVIMELSSMNMSAVLLKLPVALAITASCGSEFCKLIVQCWKKMLSLSSPPPPISSLLDIPVQYFGRGRNSSLSTS